MNPRTSAMALALICACLSVASVASAQTAAPKTATVTANAAIYIAAAISPTPLRVAAPGSVLRVIGEQGDWLQVEFNDPQWGVRTGWIQRANVQVLSPELQPMDLSVPSAAPATAPVSESPAAKPKPCVIVKIYQKRAADAFIRWTSPKPYNYVEGNLPAGMKFRNELGDNHVREIQQKGGHVVVLKFEYALPDLEDARRSCKAWQEGRE